MASRHPSTPRPLSRKHLPPPTRSSREEGFGVTYPVTESASSGRRSQRAFTILDTIAVITIITILVVLAAPNFGSFVRKAQEARCMANMRNITIGLRAYLQDHGNVWPQGPSPDAGVAWEDFWLGVLQPYGITDKTWQCPAILARAEADAPRVHYTPTLFPPVPGIADRWATHPWLIERGEGHGHGALICFPDGSIKSFDKVLAELGAR